MKRVHFIISGDVQGVGFRAWFASQANTLGCTGWVRNREDGAVEAVCEGLAENIKKMVALVRKGPEVARVDAVQVEWITTDERLFRFEIRK